MTFGTTCGVVLRAMNAVACGEFFLTLGFWRGSQIGAWSTNRRRVWRRDRWPDRLGEFVGLYRNDWRSGVAILDTRVRHHVRWRVSLDGTLMVSNATAPEDLSGWSVCGGGGLGMGGSGSVMVCVGTDSNFNTPSDKSPMVAVFTTGSLGVSGEVGPNLQFSYTWVSTVDADVIRPQSGSPSWCPAFSEAMSSQC